MTEEFLIEKDEIKKKINIETVLLETVGQKSNLKWFAHKTNKLTTSNLGKFVDAEMPLKQIVHLKNIVQQLFH